MHNLAIIEGFKITGAAAYRPFLVPAVFRVISSIRQATYHFHEVARVLSNPSRHYGEVQWVFSPPVTAYRYNRHLMNGCWMGSSEK